jgi:hypothetical protein
MSRYLKYNPNDKAPTALGDGGWLGVKMQLDPPQLPQGYASLAVNMRFREGIPETRLGSMLIPWMNRITDGLVQPWGIVYGVGDFRDPILALQYTLVAANGQVWACRANNAPKLLNLPAGVTITSPVRFLQCFDVVLMLRGFDFDELVMTDLDAGFTVVTPAVSGTGTEPLPRAAVGVHDANRALLATQDDVCWTSDILDYTHGSILDDFRINQGSADRIVQFETFGTSTVVALKGTSIYRVDGVYGNLSQATLSRVTKRYGCVAPDSVVDCGTDLLWLSQEGVSSLTLTEQNEIQAREGAKAGKPAKFDADIGPLIKRINGRYSSGATAEFWEDRFYIALPVDQATVHGPELVPQFSNGDDNTPDWTMTIPVVEGATYILDADPYQAGIDCPLIINGTQHITASGRFVAQHDVLDVVSAIPVVAFSIKRAYIGVNNVIAVYDFQNASWSGYDEIAGVGVQKLFISTYQNRERLFILTHDGFIKLYEEGYADRLAVPYTDVEVSATPVAGTTIRVNGGNTATATAATGNSGFAWGISGGNAARNLLYDNGGNAGFGNFWADSPWVAADTLCLPLFSDDGEGNLTRLGVRFYSTNGVVPSVVTTGAWATVTEVVEQDISITFITRGHVSPGNDLSRYQYAIFDLQTWRPSYTLSAITSGVNEETIISDDPVTKDRTLYYEPFNQTAYDTSNVNDDFGARARQDYSIEPESSTWSMVPGEGIRGDLHQESRDCRRANLTGRSAQLGLVNTQGRVRILAAMLDTTKEPTHPGVVA